jgi:hypothetical protein
MASLHSIFQDIADIIRNDSDMESLKQKLESDTFDWEQMVPVASSQLIIPLIYCKLQEKELLIHIPEDLNSYLKEITNQNRERNQAIIKEVQQISNMLNENKIDHVFLKGAALLVSGNYREIAERMVGDIDLLVHPDQLIKSQELIIQNGYSQAEESLTDKYFEQKHLPRLLPKKNIAAIEIHRRLVQKSTGDILDPVKVLKNKKLNGGINIPASADLLLHSILNFEINDLGYYYNYLGLRNAYDALILLGSSKMNIKNNLPNNKYTRSFIMKLSYYFNGEISEVLPASSKLRSFLFLSKQKHRSLRKVSFKILTLFNITSLIFHRLIFFIFNASYRKESYDKRKQILKFIKGRIRSI